MEAQAIPDVEEPEGGVARGEVGRPALEVDHRPPRGLDVGLDHPASRLPERPLEPPVPGPGRGLSPQEDSLAPAPAVQLDQEPLLLAAGVADEVDPLPPRTLRPPLPENPGPGDRGLEQAALPGGEEAAVGGRVLVKDPLPP